MNPIEKIIRVVIVSILVITIVLSLASCGNQHSPVDTYCDGVVNNTKDSARHAAEVADFLSK